MAQWITLPDGRMVNFDGVRTAVQDGMALLLTEQGGAVTRVGFGSTSSAASYLTQLQSALASEETGPNSVSSITPNTATNGAASTAVLRGSGFAFDLITGAFAGEIDIGTDVLSFGQCTYVDNGTLLLQWTPATGAGTYDVIYKGADGVEKARLTNGITIS